MTDAERPSDQPGPQQVPGPRGPQPQGPPPQGQPQGQRGPGYGAPGQPPQPYGQQPPYNQPGPYGPQPPYGAPQPGPTPYGQPGQPGQPGSQNPYSQPGQPGPQGQPAPQNPYGPPGPNPYGPTGAYGAQPPRGGKKSKLPLILVAAGVALLLVVGIAIAAFTGRDKDTASSGSSGGGGTTSAPQADKPSDAVRGYLQALADGDPDKAVGYLSDAPGDKTFLSKEVLAVSAKTAAISAVDVPEVTDKYAYQVPAHYKLGTKDVTEDYNVSEVGGSWQLSRAVTQLDLSYQRDSGLAMTINGVAVKTDKVSLFPGHYTFGTGSDYVSYGSENSLTLTGPSDYKSPRLEPTITSAGKSAFVDATKKAFASCLAKHQLAPKGCPNRIAADKGQKFKESTVRWSVTNNPFKNPRVTVDSSDATTASATFETEYNFKAKATLNGQAVRYDGPPIGLYSFKASGDLSKKGIPITFTRY